MKHSKEAVQVIKLVDVLKPKFFLQGWVIDIAIHKEKDFQTPDVAARINPRNCYRSASLEVFPPFFKEDEDGQRAIIVHELCHILTGIQQGLVNTARRGTQVTDAESQYAFEEETSRFAQIIDSLL